MSGLPVASEKNFASPSPTQTSSKELMIDGYVQTCEGRTSQVSETASCGQ